MVLFVYVTTIRSNQKNELNWIGVEDNLGCMNSEYAVHELDEIEYSS